MILNSKRVCRVVLTVSALAVLTTSLGSQKTRPTCDNDRQPETILLTLLDTLGEFPQDLKEEDLLLKVNGNPIPVRGVELQIGLPLDLSLLIDTSVSQEEVLPFTKLAARSAIETLLTAKDRVALLSFSDEIGVEEPLTTDLSKIAAALDRVKLTAPPGYAGGGVILGGSAIPGGAPPNKRGPGSTSLWDTVMVAMERTYNSPHDQNRRRAMILLTDGHDTSSETKSSAAIASALQRNVVVYSIGVAGRNFTLNRDPLKRLSERTGGTTAFPKKAEDLKSVLLQIGKRIRSQYVISFCRVSTVPGPLKIELDLTSPRFRNARLAFQREVN